MMLEEDPRIMDTIWRNTAINLVWFIIYVLLTGVLFNTAVALVVLTVERLRRTRRTETTATKRTPTRKERTMPRDPDGTQAISLPSRK